MTNLQETIKNIKEIKQEKKNKQISIIDLREEIKMCNTKMEWLKSDIENMIYNEFAGALNVYIKDDYIEIKFTKAQAGLNLQSAKDFAEKIGVELKDCTCVCGKDNHLFLDIKI